MRTFIDPKFWSDRDIDNCKSGSKLTALWLITCQYTSQIGVNDASEKRFSEDTGLPAEALGKCLEALPKCFVKVGDVIFVRNFIRHQFGSGETLIRNNFFIRLKSLIHALKNAELKALILEEYPEFLQNKSQDEGLAKGLPSPSTGRVGKGKEEEVQEKPSKRSGTREEAVEYAVELGLPESDGEHFFDSQEAGGWVRNGKPIKDWKAAMRAWKSGNHLPSLKTNGRPLNGHSSISSYEQAPMIAPPKRPDFSNDRPSSQS